ncbi:MAG: ABC transporter substrate-binding protein, partial [Rubrivivax sp.]
IDSQSHADVRRSLELIAQLLGTPQEAARLWQRIEGDIAAAAAQVPEALRGLRVYVEIGAGPYAAGASSFIGETLARLGMANAVPPEMGPFPKLNPEFVVRSQPDIVMAVKRSLQSMRDRPGWHSLHAFQRGRVCGFEPDRYEVLVRPGPRLGEAARLLAGCLAGLPTDAAR